MVVTKEELMFTIDELMTAIDAVVAIFVMVNDELFSVIAFDIDEDSGEIEELNN